jgi:opacity protein-like surface antigen
MRDTYSDSFTSSNSTGLANLYADLPVSERFTPYIGAGIGYVRHQLKGRSFSRVTQCVDTSDCHPTLVDAQPGAVVLNTTTTTTAGGINYQLAAALMAGFTYKVWDNTKLDIGYRWLHLQGTSYTGRSPGLVENLKIPDQNIHEMRVGLRYDIN